MRIFEKGPPMKNGKLKYLFLRWRGDGASFVQFIMAMSPQSREKWTRIFTTRGESVHSLYLNYNISLKETPISISSAPSSLPFYDFSKCPGSLYLHTPMVVSRNGRNKGRKKKRKRRKGPVLTRVQ